MLYTIVKNFQHSIPSILLANLKKGLLFPILIISFLTFSCTVKNNNNVISYKDTAQITTIKVKQGNNEEIVLSKKKAGWLINDKYKADYKTIDNFMLTISQIKIQNYVNNDSLLDYIQKKGKHLKIFNQKNELLSSWIIGSYNKKLEGTYILKKSKKIYVVNIPEVLNNLNRTIGSRIFNWTSRYIIDYKANEIKEVEIIYPSNPEKSFNLKITPKEIEIHSKNTSKKVENFDKQSVAIYLHYFEKIPFDSIASTQIVSKSKSRLSQFPINIIKIKSKNKTTEFATYALYNNNYENNIDIHRVLVYNKTADIWYVTKYFNLDLITKELSYFTQ